MKIDALEYELAILQEKDIEVLERQKMILYEFKIQRAHLESIGKQKS